MKLPFRKSFLSLLLPAPALAFGTAEVDRAVVRAGALEHAVTPGEALPVAVVVENRGDVAATDVRVRVQSTSGWSRDLVLELVEPGERVSARVTLDADEAARLASPHFLSVVVDPQDAIAESTEENNVAVLRKPVFVVDLDYRQPELPEEHDDVFVLHEGRPASHSTARYGVEGAPSFVEPLVDVEKAQPSLEPGLQIDGIAGAEQPRDSL